MEEKLKLKENASMSTLIIVENGKVKESNNCFVTVKETIVTLMKNVIAKNTSHNTVFKNYRKVTFNIASEASYIYISSGQNQSHKKCQKWSILVTFWKPKVCFPTDTALPDRSF